MKNLMLVLCVLSLVFVSCTKEEGCTDINAVNYNPDAIVDNGSCYYNNNNNNPTGCETYSTIDTSGTVQEIEDVINQYVALGFTNLMNLNIQNDTTVQVVTVNSNGCDSIISINIDVTDNSNTGGNNDYFKFAMRLEGVYWNQVDSIVIMQINTQQMVIHEQLTLLPSDFNVQLTDRLVFTSNDLNVDLPFEHIQGGDRFTLTIYTDIEDVNGVWNPTYDFWDFWHTNTNLVSNSFISSYDSNGKARFSCN